MRQGVLLLDLRRGGFYRNFPPLGIASRALTARFMRSVRACRCRLRSVAAPAGIWFPARYLRPGVAGAYWPDSVGPHLGSALWAG